MNSHITNLHGKDHEERAALREKISRLNKEAADNWTNPQWRAEMAQEMTETIYMGFQHENLLSIMSQVENLPFDGRAFVKEVRGLRAFWVARGGYIESSSVQADVLEIPRDTIGFHVYEFEDKLMTNFAETQANLVDLGIQRMDAEVNRRALNLFQAAVPTTSPYYSHGTGVGLSAINTALREVRDASRDFQVAIVGRSTMTEQIMDELLGSSTNGAGFLPSTNEDFVNRGVIGTYRGANIITLRNWKDDADEAFFPANELYVIATDASKFAFWGGLMTKEYVEDDNWYWHYLARRDFGGVVHRPDRIRRIVDDSITA